MEEQIIFEEIRSYIQGKMTSEEAASFEEKLAKDENLRREYQNIREVGHAVTKVHSIEAIRASIEADEGKVTEPSPSLESDLLNLEKELDLLDATEDKQKKSSKVVQMNFTRIAASLAVAASLAFAVIIPVNRYRLGTAGYNYAPSNLEGQQFRGDSDNLVEEAITSYNKGQYRDAETKLEQAIKELDESISQLGDSDTDIMNKLTLSSEKHEAEWYCALSYMKDRKINKAKKLLGSIANSDNPHSEEALRILENVY